MTPLRGVVFDIDDTLYLEADYVLSGFRVVGQFVFEHSGMTDFATRAWSLFQAGDRGNIFDKVLAEAGKPHAFDVRVLVDVYRNHSPPIQLLPDAQQCLEELLGKVQLACVTGGAPASQRAKVAALQLERYFSTIVFTGALGSSYEKPHPRGFERAQEALGLPGNQMVYVGDNPAKDFHGPRELGWRTIRVRRAGSQHEAVPTPAFVDQEVSELNRLTAFLALESAPS
jgi:putative hydrolase of the HAD superfamily